MLFSTSLVALILSPRRLQITNTKVRYSSFVPELYMIMLTEAAAIYHMRVDISNDRTGGQAESETTCHSARRLHLSIRYSDDETPFDN